MSPDPIQKGYPMLTPYQFFSDNPIMNIDLDGMEGYPSVSATMFGAAGITTSTEQQINADVHQTAASVAAVIPSAKEFETGGTYAGYTAFGLMVGGVIVGVLGSETGVGEVAGTSMFRTGAAMGTGAAAVTATAQLAQGKVLQAGTTAALTAVGMKAEAAMLKALALTTKNVGGQILTIAAEDALQLVQQITDKATEKTQTAGASQGGGTTGNTATQGQSTNTQSNSTTTQANTGTATQGTTSSPAASVGVSSEIQGSGSGTGKVGADESTGYSEE